MGAGLPNPEPGRYGTEYGFAIGRGVLAEWCGGLLMAARDTEEEAEVTLDRGEQFDTVGHEGRPG